MTRRVVLVGGGVAGLATAHALRRARRDPGDLEILGFEAADHLGGSLSTERRDGFVIEAGADSFLATHPAGMRLVRELGLEDRLVGVPPRLRRTYVLHRGRLHPLPEGFRLLAVPRLAPLLRSPLLSWRGKLRAAQDLVRRRRRGPGDESLASFVRRRLGTEILERIAGPMVAGIHAGDPERLSMEALLPKFLEYERTHGSVIRGLRAEPTGPPKGLTLPGPFASFRGGMAELVDALVDRTPGVDWRTGMAVESIERAARGFEVALASGEIVPAHAVVLAAPARASANLVRSVHVGVAQALRSLPASSSAVVSLAFPETSLRPLDGTGFLVARTERVRLKACTWSSSKFPARAPAGHALLRAFYGGVGDEEVLDLSDDELVALAVRELGPLLGVRDAPGLVRVHRWRAAHPQYEVGHRDRIAALQSLVAGVPGLELTGSSYRGIGVPDCVDDAERAAGSVLGSLRLEAAIPPATPR